MAIDLMTSNNDAATTALTTTASANPSIPSPETESSNTWTVNISPDFDACVRAAWANYSYDRDELRRLLITKQVHLATTGCAGKFTAWLKTVEIPRSSAYYIIGGKPSDKPNPKSVTPETTIDKLCKGLDQQATTAVLVACAQIIAARLDGTGYTVTINSPLALAA